MYAMTSLTESDVGSSITVTVGSIVWVCAVCDRIEKL